VSEEIDAAKVEAICTVLKAALPELVTIAYGAFKADKFAVSTIAAGLSDAEWKKVKRDENQRREGETMRKICRCDLCGDWTWSECAPSMMCRLRSWCVASGMV